MTRIVLIAAAPTPWDLEGRLAGNTRLPITTDGEIALRKLLDTFDCPITTIYTYRANEACELAAKLLAHRFGARIHDATLLEPVSLGLWQGLTREELRFRFPTVFAQWEQDPLSVHPPEGEAIEDAVERFRKGLRKILKRNRRATIAIVLRPIGLQIVKGIVGGEDLPTIAAHLQEATALERMDLDDQTYGRLTD